MSYSTKEMEGFALPLPVTQKSRHLAQQFASLQPTHQKAEQVRLNTLAVCAVKDYLQMMGIPTNLSASDSWNPVVRLCADVADLEVTGIGKLECRPLKMQEQICYVPPEVWSDRIGYVMVEIDESLRQVNVLGFTQTAAVEMLPISQLRPIEDLIDRLSQLTHPLAVASSVASNRTLVNLSRWFENLFETGWQPVEALLKPAFSSPAFSFRGKLDAFGETDDDLPNQSVRRAKLTDHSVALIVELRPESEQKTNILLQVQPTGSLTYLPPLLKLIVLDDSGETFLEVEARNTDDYMQLELSGNQGERFSVKIVGDTSTMEEFVI